MLTQIFALIVTQNQGKLLPWLPTHMIHSSPATEQKFAMQYDSYGDSFTQDATEESLKKVFSSFENQVSYLRAF